MLEYATTSSYLEIFLLLVFKLNFNIKDIFFYLMTKKFFVCTILSFEPIFNLILRR
jgi:hypothetical protein